MKYVDEFRDRRIIAKLAEEIRASVDLSHTYNFMDVCGTHTMNIFRYGLRDILPDDINLISGPGCPVCVTPNEFIDKAIWLANQKNVVVTTFGDMVRVQGSRSSLEKEKSRAACVKTAYSSVDALEYAVKNTDKEVVFLGIGFETTAPTIAQSILIAKKKKISNYSVLCGHKTMPEALRAISRDKEIKVDGFLLPGHVSAIIGAKPYEFLARKLRKRCVIAGFEPADILQSILMLIAQKKPKIEIEYTRIISKKGNPLARHCMEKVFEKADSEWRGLGIIEKSCLKIRREFCDFDAEYRFKPRILPVKENKGCVCGEVLKGTKTPLECRLFSRVCNPENPVGACMVSSEGSCAAYFKYKK